ncbi:uncharacterized protein [Diabrotica undecimpunctata]|uniref:uncharacterized protein n=1 Tax=Diabrotica undecimpunctata TaxID=50387 RepID=UPI003B63F21B
MPFNAFQLTRVPFGLCSSPFLATRVLKHTADNNRDDFSLACDILLYSTYIDDILAGCDSLEALELLFSQLKILLGKHGFNLHKVSSNNEEFLRRHGFKRLTPLTHNLSDSSSKILGVKWNQQSDTFSFSPPNFDLGQSITKRKVLSILMSTFDPMNLAGYITASSKILLKHLWQVKLSWDEPIFNPEWLNDWKILLDGFQSIPLLKFPRCLVLDKRIIDVQLHTFCDSSLKIFATCTYLRVMYEDYSVSSRLVSSKSRIASTKQNLTIPRLELNAVLIGVILTQSVSNVLRGNWPIAQTHIYSDSLVALSWILNKRLSLNPYVHNRVQKIIALSKDYSFHHIPSQLNVADIPTRPRDITRNSKLSMLWLSGPEFLIKHPLDFSQFKIILITQNLPEIRSTQVTLTTASSEIQVNETLEFIFFKFSTFSHMQRVLAYVSRFIKNLKNKSSNLSLLLSSLQNEEIEAATLSIVRYLQLRSFHRELLELKSGKPLSNRSLRQSNVFYDQK